MLVKLAQLTRQLVTSEVKPGTTLEEYLTKRKLRYGASIRVNAKVMSRGYKLHNGNIITVIGNVTGGY